MEKECKHKWALISKEKKDDYNFNSSSVSPQGTINYWYEYEFYCEKCLKIETIRI